ncbi:TPA: ABCC4 protein-like [Bos taurus]|nr:TPA: ABCC4 protein-like [Bos taurus]
MLPVSAEVKTSPVQKANFCSRLFVWWLNPLFKIGHKRKLEPDDMYSVLPEDRSQRLGEELQGYWDQEVKRAQKDAQEPSLVKAIIKCYWKSYLIWGMFTFLEEGTRVVQPIFLGKMISYVENYDPNDSAALHEAYGYAAALSACVLVWAVLHHLYFYHMQRVGMRLRVAVCHMIYRKEPVLFTGTMRKNLDPFNEHTDKELWNALEEAPLSGALGAAVSLTGSIKRACSLSSHLRGPRQSPPGWPLVLLPPPLPTPGPRGRGTKRVAPPCAPLPEAGGSVSPREDRAVSEPPASPPAPPGAAPSPEQRDPDPRLPPRQDAEAQPAAGRELLLAPVFLVRARLGCDTSAVVGRVLDAAAALLGTEEGGGRGEGALSAGALGTWELVARGATWSLASGEPGRGNSCWLNPLFKIGYKRRLEEDDMYSVLLEDRSQHLGEELQGYWDQEVLRAEKDVREPSLMKAILKCHWKSYLVLGIFILLEVMTDRACRGRDVTGRRTSVGSAWSSTQHVTEAKAGRILNRFSKDIGHMDDSLPLIFQDFIQVLILEMKRIVKSCTQKCSRDLTADSVACGHGFNCYQCELLWDSEAEDFYCKDV